MGFPTSVPLIVSEYLADSTGGVNATGDYSTATGVFKITASTGQALRINEGADALTITGGTYSAYNEGGQGIAFAFGVSSSDGATSTVSGVTFKSDQYVVGIDSGRSASSNWTFDQCTFEHTGDGSTFMGLWNVNVESGWTYLDCTFTNCDARNIQKAHAAGYINDFTGVVNWSITINGGPGDAYTCVDANTVTQASGNLDGAGTVTVELPEVSLVFVAPATKNHVEHNDYTITVNGVPQTVTVDAVKTVNF